MCKVIIIKDKLDYITCYDSCISKVLWRWDRALFVQLENGNRLDVSENKHFGTLCVKNQNILLKHETGWALCVCCEDKGCLL